MFLEGKIIGNRYEIIEKIGNGGMATVYKAKCHVLNRYVAIKVLKDEFTTDEEFIKRFNTEAQSAASLTHPNIVSIYDVGNEGNIYYIVMELIQGKTLKEIISEDGALPWKWSINIAIQIASALEIAHKNNIIHRDIKPHNIIITEDGIAKVTDFGIAKAVSNSTITAFGTTIGSVHYFSPEHARGGYTDAKSDLYSLGVVMYEMLTGRVPFDADTPVSVALKHMQEKPVEPIKLNPSIPFAVNQIIMKAMQKESNLRYDSATEMLRDLTSSLKNPEGNFVENRNFDSDKTQRIPTINPERLDSNKKRKKQKEKQKKIVLLISALIGLIILSILGGYLIVSSIFKSPKNVEVPDIVGLTIDEAKVKLQEQELSYEIIDQIYSKEIEEGKVISQDPKNGVKTEKDKLVKITVSKGAETVLVPKVAGKTLKEAQNDLEKQNLKVEVIEETSQKVEEGIIISQDPKENTKIDVGGTVKITVSKGTGIKKIAVPSVISEEEETAKKELIDQGFEVDVVYEEDRSKDNGTVLKQSLDVGKTVDEKTKIIITVNKIAEKKVAKIYVNIKSLTGGYEEPKPKKVETTTETVTGEKTTNTESSTDSSTSNSQDEDDDIVRTVAVRVEVEGEVICNEQKVDKNITNLLAGEAVGTGTITVKVFINESRKKQVDIDLSKVTEYTIE